ncbi:MAG: hypothetical protein R2909_23940, partial [Gemmatimonadales bacterium]
PDTIASRPRSDSDDGFPRCWERHEGLGTGDPIVGKPLSEVQVSDAIIDLEIVEAFGLRELATR